MPLVADDSTREITPRRQIAENVVALFPDDAQPIPNTKWRGRYPRNVTRFRRWGSYLCVGDEAVLYTFDDDHGKRVRLVRHPDPDDVKRLELTLRSDCYFLVESLSSPFHLYADDGSVTRVSSFFIESKELRRPNQRTVRD